MLKRSFWLLLAAVAGALIWAWARQRRDEFSDHTPQFTPPRQFTAPPGTFAPADDDQVAPAEAPAEAEPPSEAQAATPDEAETPAEAPAEAEPPSEAQAATPDEAEAPAEAPAEAEPPAEAQAATPDEAEAPADAAQDEILGYCVRCRTKRPMQHAHEETTESGRRAARGSCPVCGANMFTFLAANDDDHGADA